MQTYTIQHPHAQLAVWLAYRLKGAPSDLITRTLSTSGCPRALYVLAAVLQAATAPGAVVDVRA